MSSQNDKLSEYNIRNLGGGVFLEWGSSSFTNDGTDTTVRTALDIIEFAGANYTVAAATAQLCTDAGFPLSITTSVSSGTLTVSRDATSATDATDATFAYLILGRKYSSD